MSKELLVVEKKYKVIRQNTTIKVNKKVYKTGAEFISDEARVKSLLQSKYIEEVKEDGKSINS